MELAIIVGLICFMSSMFGMWAGARYNPLSVKAYVEPKKWPKPVFCNKCELPVVPQRRYDGAVPTLEPVPFYRDPTTGRFVKNK